MEKNERKEYRQFCSIAVFQGSDTTAKLQLQRTRTWRRTSATEIPANTVIQPSRSITMLKQMHSLEAVKGKNDTKVPPSNLTGHRFLIVIKFLVTAYLQFFVNDGPIAYISSSYELPRLLRFSTHS